MKTHNITVIIDGGHGWDTAGKRSQDGTLRENEFNDSIVSRLAYGLSQEKINYALLAPEWSDVPLDERVKREHSIYRDSDHTTIVISIHADAWTAESANGFTIFRFSNTRNELSHLLAKIVHRHFKNKNPLRDRGVKGKNLKILRETKSPSILIEAGFMTNDNDRQHLKSEVYRNRITNNIIAAIKEFSFNHL